MRVKCKCKICGKEYYGISPSHLATHDLTRAQYVKMYPDEKKNIVGNDYSSEFGHKCSEIDSYAGASYATMESRRYR